MTDDIIAAIRSQLKDRIANPFSGAFAISWAAWNYRFIMVLISFEPFHQKFAYIDDQFFTSYVSLTDPNSLLLRGVLGPAITALAYLYLYPYPSRAIFKVVHSHKLRLRKLRQSIENQKLLSVQESREMLKRFAVSEDEHNQVVVNLRSEITQLKEALVQDETERNKEILEERNRLETKIEELTERLIERGGIQNKEDEGEATDTSEFGVETSPDREESQRLSALLAVGTMPRSHPAALLGSTEHANLVRLELDLKWLEDAQLVKRGPNGYYITDAGRDVLVKAELV